jgi:hypothetical protein
LAGLQQNIEKEPAHLFANTAGSYLRNDTRLQFKILWINGNNILHSWSHKKIDERMAEIVRTESWPGRVEKYFSTLPRRMLLSGKRL